MLRIALRDKKQRLPPEPPLLFAQGSTRKPDEPLFSTAVLSCPQIREGPFFLALPSVARYHHGMVAGEGESDVGVEKAISYQ
jgi:hypothetical protein